MINNALRRKDNSKTGNTGLTVRLFTIFFSGLFLFSVICLFLFSHLLQTLEAETIALNKEQINSASVKLDAVLQRALGSHSTIIEQEPFKTYNGLEPSTYKLHQMQLSARNIFQGEPAICSWAVFLQGSNHVISSNGVNTLGAYVRETCVNPRYDEAFWVEQLSLRYSHKYEKTDHFTLQIATSDGRSAEKTLLPLLLKSYWKNNILVAVYLDMETVCQEVGSYMSRGNYLFSEDGTLLYCTDRQPLITQIPEEGRLSGENGNAFAVYAACPESGLQHVKLIPESEAMGMIKSSRSFFLGVMLTSLLLISVFILFSIRRSVHPVDSMLGLLQQNAEFQRSGDIQEACAVLEKMLKQREEQANKLARQDSVLSEYFLQSQLKNVYVDMRPQERRIRGLTYILYIQVRYRETAKQYFSGTMAQTEKLLQQMLSDTLQRFFETSLIFQSETGRFWAKVTLPEGETNIALRMDNLLCRLTQKEEAASFIVVQSEAVEADADLSVVYKQVQNAARSAKVGGGSQLLVLPVCQEGEMVCLEKIDLQNLNQLLYANRTEDAVRLTERILEDNVRQGITIDRMEQLCMTIINTAAHTLSELSSDFGKIFAVSDVYRELTENCDTAQAYCQLIAGFLRGSSETEKTENDILLYRIRQYIQENYEREFSGEEMAEALQVSRSYLSSYYKEKTGVNLSDSIARFRMQKAILLLQDPDTKIQEIGPQIGVYNRHTFLRLFRKHTGMTPKEYRMMHLQK